MRSIWSGAISFGLVHIPVKLYNASVTQDLDLDLLRKDDLCPIHYAKVCRASNEEVPNDQIVKGFEYRKGEYVVLTDEDFRRANVKKTQTIEIVAFIEAKDVDFRYLEKPYYLEPVKEASRAYALLREAMRRTNKVAVARFVLRTREHMALIMVDGDVLVLDQMRFAAEIKPPEELTLPARDEKTAERELDLAVKLIGQLAEPWQPDQYHDTYTEEIMRIVEQKAQGKQPAPVGEEPIPATVSDLFAKLRESLDQTSKHAAS